MIKYRISRKVKTHKVKVTQTFVYEIDVEAKSQKEAIEIAKYRYKNEPDGYLGVADANSHNRTTFKILKED